MNDLISRQAAIKAICEDGTWLESQGCTEITMIERKQRDADILGELPSAQPERKEGKWIEKEVYETRRKEEMQIAKCSNCKKYLTTPHIYSFNHYNYCPYCGAKM